MLSMLHDSHLVMVTLFIRYLRIICVAYIDDVYSKTCPAVKHRSHIPKETQLNPYMFYHMFVEMLMKADERDQLLFNALKHVTFSNLLATVKIKTIERQLLESRSK